MIDELLNLRNKVHKDKFRFDLTRDLWESQYITGSESCNVIKITKDGKLSGYAVYSVTNDDQNRVLNVQEICSDGKATLTKLLDSIVGSGLREEADFILLRRCTEPYGDVFDQKDFLTIMESAVMIALLNSREILSALSENFKGGKPLTLRIRGFDPVTVEVGKKGIMLLEDTQSKVNVLTDSMTFLNFLFGKTSFWKELVKRKVTFNILHLPTVYRFFKSISNKKWYIPPGDWC